MPTLTEAYEFSPWSFLRSIRTESGGTRGVARIALVEILRNGIFNKNVTDIALRPVLCLDAIGNRPLAGTFQLGTSDDHVAISDFRKDYCLCHLHGGGRHQRTDWPVRTGGRVEEAEPAWLYNNEAGEGPFHAMRLPVPHSNLQTKIWFGEGLAGDLTGLSLYVIGTQEACLTCISYWKDEHTAQVTRMLRCYAELNPFNRT